jgi:microcin C transport system substrate-binding protein
MRTVSLHLLILISAVTAVACGGGTSNTQQSPASSSTAPAASRANVSTDKNSYPVFPNADAGADPSVPADQGGKGFKGDGWETNTNFDLIGDPRAVKGGTLREYQLDFPSTMRIYGPEVTAFNFYWIQNLVYEGLLGLHPTTLEYIPALATHWQISPDKLTYRFRLDPNAKFSNGEPVTASDVVASFKFLMDKGLQERGQILFRTFDTPVAESKYVVRVHAKDLNWQNFMHFATQVPVLPSSVLNTIDGAKYLKEYNFKVLPGSGPYTLNEADLVKGKTITIRRRKDYWGENQRRNVGANNFDELRETTIRDQNLVLQTFKKGDLDYYYVNVSREWLQEFNFDKVQRGLIQKRKIFNAKPGIIQGLAINTRKAPFDDIRVRQALNLLLNRRLLIQQLFFNEYVPLNSDFADSVYENKNNPKNEYDPQKALALLGEAGWNARDGQGRLVKNGQPLAVELLYASQGAERWLTVYQNDLKKVGITLNLRLVSFETQVSLMYERKFDLLDTGWVVPAFPDPDTEYRSSLADVPNSNNVTGFKDPKVDALLDQYNKEFDFKKRVAMIQQLDGILANAYEYVLEWDAPFTRLAYSYRLGQPEGYFTRIGDYYDMLSLWWVDPAKEQELNRAIADPSVKLPVGLTDVHYWEEYDRTHAIAVAPTK